MRWTGKIIGALLGISRGPVGALIGLAIGHVIDLILGQREGTAGGDPATIRAAWFETAFAVMGYLAKADGRVSEAEIGAARAMMREMRLGDAQVAQAIGAFGRGKQPDYPIEPELARLRALCGARHDLLRFFVYVQMRTALSGNDLEGPVRDLLIGVAQRLGFAAVDVLQLEQALRAQQGPSGSAAEPADARLARAYGVLGIAASASDAEVKKAYRRQMNENHPDKLVARGLPESMQDVAKQKTQRIREAYEVICEHRGIR